MQPSQQTTEQQLRALAVALRDKAVADARQNLKVAREIERAYGLTPSNARGKP